MKLGSVPPYVLPISADNSGYVTPLTVRPSHGNQPYGTALVLDTKGVIVPTGISAAVVGDTPAVTTLAPHESLPSISLARAAPLKEGPRLGNV